MLEKNVEVVHPERLVEMKHKEDTLNEQLNKKDSQIEEILQEIAAVKNEKDELQNELLLKKQKIEAINIDFNSKEAEY